MLLEKVSIHTEILFVHCYKFFFIITCSFSVFVENFILLPKGINCILLPKGINKINLKTANDKKN
jgi:hypothetical protein